MLFFSCQFLIHIFQFSPCVLEFGEQDITFEFNLFRFKRLIFQCLVTLPREFFKLGAHLFKDNINAFYLLPDDFKFTECFLLALVKFCNPGNLVNNLPPFHRCHGNNLCDISLHYYVIAFRGYPCLCKLGMNLSEAYGFPVKVKIAVIRIFSPSDLS
ncbi:hypothetical protein DSECCO2_430390 [anaerobic digester metagenome]